jgi:hypothetical protein
MICFWKSAVMIRTGMIARKVAVLMVSQGKEYSPG